MTQIYWRDFLTFFYHFSRFVSCNSYVSTICIASHTVKVLLLAYMK